MTTNEPLTLSEIARRLGLGAPTVTNWRNRYQDFPEPRKVVGKRELWTLDQIEQFMTVRGLDGRDRKPRSKRKRQADLTTVAGMIDALRDYLRPDLAILYLVAQIWNIYQSPSRYDLRRLSEELRRSSLLHVLASAVDAARASEQVSLLTNIEVHLRKQIADPAKRASFADEIRIQWSRLGRERAATTSPDELGQIVSQLIHGNKVLELCAGLGSTIRYMPTAKRIVAQEFDPTAAAMMSVLLSLEEVATEILVEDSLNTLHREWLGTFDVVVAFPPSRSQNIQIDFRDDDPRWSRFDGLRLRPEDSWILNALGYLNPDGLAVIGLPTRWMTSAASSRFRTKLVVSGHLQASISLGAGFFTDNRVEMTLLIISGRAQPNRPIRIIDGRSRDHLTGTNLAAHIGSLLRTTQSVPEVINMLPSDLVRLGTLLEFSAVQAVGDNVDPVDPRQATQSLLNSLTTLSDLHQVLLTQLSDLISLCEGLRFGKEHPVLRLEDFASIEIFSQALDPKWPSFDIQPTDVLLSLSPDTKGHFRVLCTHPDIPYDAGWPGTDSLSELTRVCRIRPQPFENGSATVATLTLYFYLDTPVVQDRLKNVAATQARNYIPREVLRNLRIPCAPPAVQKIALEIFGRDQDLALQQYLTQLDRIDDQFTALVALILEKGKQ